MTYEMIMIIVEINSKIPYLSIDFISWVNKFLRSLLKKSDNPIKIVNIRGFIYIIFYFQIS